MLRRWGGGGGGTFGEFRFSSYLGLLHLLNNDSQGAGSSFDSSWVRYLPRGREEHSLFSPKELESLGPKGPEISLLSSGS